MKTLKDIVIEKLKLNKSSKLNNNTNDHKLMYSDQMSFSRAFVKIANETFGKDELKRKKINVSIYFDNVDCVDPNDDSTIHGVICDGKMTWGEATEKLIEYFKTTYKL